MTRDSRQCVVAIAMIVVGCTAPTERDVAAEPAAPPPAACRCLMDMPTGLLDVACGESACVGGAGYLCMAANSPQEDASVCPPPANFTGGTGGALGLAEHVEVLDGLSRRFGLYAPSVYTGETGVPLVLHFHGWRPQPAGVGDEVEYVWAELAELHGFIAVALEGQPCPELNPGGAPFACFSERRDAAAIDALVAHIGGLYNIDTDRLYLAGHSGGGFFVQGFGIRNADRFAAAAVFNAGCISASDRYGNSCIVYASDSAVAVRKMPFYVMHNPRDQVVPFEYSEDLESTLTMGGHSVLGHLRTYNGGRSGHSINSTLVPQVWEFLSQYQGTEP